MPGDEENEQESYATLPVLLRSKKEEGLDDKSLFDLKHSLCVAYNQEDIPIQPKLGLDEIPLTENQLFSYLSSGVENATAWLVIEGSQNADDFERTLAKKKKEEIRRAVPQVVVGKGRNKQRHFKTVRGVYATNKGSFERVTSLLSLSNFIWKMSEVNSKTPEVETATLTVVKKDSSLFLGKEGDSESTFSKQWLPSHLSFKEPFVVLAAKQGTLAVPPKKR